MNILRNLILFANLAVFLALVNWGIYTAELNIANGEVAYMELAPVDPRSLIQGDYMQLAYAIERDAQTAENPNFSEDYKFERHGQLVVRFDERRVLQFIRLYEGESLAEGELLLNFASPYGWSIEVGIDSFFFQEGLAERYATARYAEVRLLQDGNIMLIDLVGEDLEALVSE